MASPLPPLQQLNRTFIGSVLFLDIVNYSQQTVPGQEAMKEVFIDLLIEALKHVGAGERIMVDTGDGAAVAFLADPEDALFTALTLRDAIEAGDAPILGVSGFVRMGINLGPLKVVRDVNGHVNMIGDGVNDAQRVMSFAQPGQVTVSHSYYDMISRFSRDYSSLFVYEGTKHDKHVREHEVYRLGEAEATEMATEIMRDRSRARQNNIEAKPGLAGGARFFKDIQHLKRSSLITATAGAVLMLIVAFALVHRAASPTLSTPSARSALAAQERAMPTAPPTREDGAAPAPVAAGVNSTAPRNMPQVVKLNPDELARAQPVAYISKTGADSPVAGVSPANHTENAAGTAPASASSTTPAVAAASNVKPGTVTLAIEPWGEIYVDGSRRGISPPTKSLTLPPGKHQIMVRNSTFAPYKQTVEIQSGANTTIHYAF